MHLRSSTLPFLCYLLWYGVRSLLGVESTNTFIEIIISKSEGGQQMAKSNVHVAYFFRAKVDISITTLRLLNKILTYLEQ